MIKHTDFSDLKHPNNPELTVKNIYNIEPLEMDTNDKCIIVHQENVNDKVLIKFIKEWGTII